MLPVSGNPIYYVEDLLGTSRVITTNTGVVCYDADFYPFGGERPPYTNNCPATNNYKFEGKERDSETGNDDFGARYYSNRFGRWLSADWSAVPVPVHYANLTNPQTLNLYAMVAADPESFADLDGHGCNMGGGGEISCSFGTQIPPPRGEGPNGNTGTGVQNTQTQDQVQAEAAQNANQQQAQADQPPPDQVDLMMQANAQKVQDARAEQNRPATEADKANALKQAGRMGDAGVKAGLVVVGAE